MHFRQQEYSCKFLIVGANAEFTDCFNFSSIVFPPFKGIVTEKIIKEAYMDTTNLSIICNICTLICQIVILISFIRAENK